MQDIKFAVAGPLINREVMEDNAWRHIVGLKPPKNRGGRKRETALRYEERLTIKVIAGWIFVREDHSRTGDLVKVLETFLDRKYGAVMRILRDLEEARFIKQFQGRENGTFYYWRLADDLIEKLNRLVELLAIIDQIIVCQSNDPENPDAGKNLLSEADQDIYYNLLSRRNDHRKNAKGVEHESNDH